MVVHFQKHGFLVVDEWNIETYVYQKIFFTWTVKESNLRSLAFTTTVTPRCSGCGSFSTTCSTRVDKPDHLR